MSSPSRPPISQSPAVGAARTPYDETLPREKVKILLVDDNDDIRAVINDGASAYKGVIPIERSFVRFLLELGSAETETERLKRQERELRERVTKFRGGDRMARDALHRRG